MDELQTPTIETQAAPEPSDEAVLEAIRAYKQEADAARRLRMALDRQIRDAYLCIQDWSHKQEGQSREFLPKLAVSIEQFAQFVKRALTDFGQWFSVQLPENSPISAADVEKLLQWHLDNLSRTDEHRSDFATLISDAVKAGSLGSLVILKVHGRAVERTEFVVERAVELVTVTAPDGLPVEVPQETLQLGRRPVRRWQLFIDIVRPQDFYIDPTGRGLYVIHEVERDLHDVQALADAGVYDRDAVAKLAAEDFPLTERPPEEQGERGGPIGPIGPRKRVVLSEFWGTILAPDGSVLGENRLVTVANDRVVLRNVENPFWHGQSPFVWAPLIRVPFTVWHKGLFDAATRLNLALNELFNLMLDGGLASVWGVRQLREEALADPRQVASGIPQGATLVVRGDALPVGGKVLEQVTTGTVPAEALALYNLADREYQAASLTNDLKLGQLPPRTVKATEIIESQQSLAVTLDGILRDLEDKLIQPLLTKAWLTILQHADELVADEIASVVGPRTTLTLARMSPAERFVALGPARFRVFGLSAVVTRARDFQKLMALLATIRTDPLLVQAFYRRFSPSRVLDMLLKKLGLDPTGMERGPEEAAQAPPGLEQLLALTGLGPSEPRAGGAPIPRMPGLSSELTGEPNLPAEIAQEMRPTGAI
jgi:hypothetical protein